jgi:uncharacterized membrane protein SpoIIM required for sporulation
LEKETAILLGVSTFGLFNGIILFVNGIIGLIAGSLVLFYDRKNKLKK